MKRLYVALFAVAVFGLLNGCPGGGGSFQFTSADTNGRFNGPVGAPTDGAGGGDGEGETPQPREVVEPDVIRRDDNLLYVLNQYRGLSIVDLGTEKLLTQVPVQGYPRDLYVAGNRAYVLVAYVDNGGDIGRDVIGYSLASRLYVIDISDVDNASIVNSFNLDGDLIDSRMVGDVLYAVSAQYQWVWGGEGDGGGVVPPGGSVGSPPMPRVVKQQTSSSWVTSVDLADESDIHVVDTLSFAGYGNVIQATSTALFVASNDWNLNTSPITYIDISDAGGNIAVRGSAQALGYVADRFKLDAYNNVLRVVSNTWWPERETYVTTYDISDPDNIAQLGQLRLETASGDQLFATRFDGDKAYVVTYFVVDPLYVLDLSDPANPAVAGELEVPGWSTHIEPRGDRLIALGVDDTSGRKVSVSLFDVSDPSKPTLLDRESFGQDWSWSNAYSDVKAFTVLEDVLIVPFSGWEEGGRGFERLQFLSWNANGLDARGHVDLQGQIMRSLQYAENYYGVTTEQVAVIDASKLDAPEVTNAVKLAEYVADHHELGGGVGVSVISHYSSGGTTLKAVNADGDELGAIDVDVAYLTDSFRYGQSVVLVEAAYDTRGYYHVLQVNFGNPAAPAVVLDKKIEMQPYWAGYWWYDIPGGGGGIPVDVAAKDVAIWPGWSPMSPAFLLGDTLALRGVAEGYNVTFGDDAPAQGLALVNLAAGGAVQMVGLGYKDLRSIDTAGNKLYLTTVRDAGTTLLGLPLDAWYVQEFDPAAVSVGPATNVPGSFVNYNAGTGVLTLLDYSWENNFSIRQSLRTVIWVGGAVQAVADDFELPASSGMVKARGNFTYFESYDNGYRLHGLRIANNGDINEAGVATTGNQWAYLLDADDSQAYAVVGSSSVARFDFENGGALAATTPLASTPIKLRFGATATWAPLGYAGLAKIN